MIGLLVAATISVDFVQNSFADEWFAVRTGTAPAPYAKAMDVAKEVADDRSALAAMGSIDGLAAQAGSSAELVSLLGQLPDRLEFQTVKGVARRVAEEIAKVRLEAREAFKAEYSPRTLHAANLLRKELHAAPGLLDKIAGDLEIKLDSVSVRVLIVPAAPRPGAATYRTPKGPLCVVGMLGFAEHELLEAVAHEVTHAMDELSRGQDTVLNRLRKRLEEREVTASDPRYRDLPHALIFVAAAARVAEVKGPRYVPYGEAQGAYLRLGEPARIVRGVWPEKKGDEAINEIVRKTLGG
jgi:hypothetical protein